MTDIYAAKGGFDPEPDPADIPLSGEIVGSDIGVPNTTWRPEPALILGVIFSVSTFLVSLNLPWFSASAAAAIMSLIGALFMAVFTKPIGPALYVGVISAAAAVAAQYGLHWPDASVAAVSGVVLATFALFGVRPQVLPTNAKNEVQ